MVDRRFEMNNIVALYVSVNVNSNDCGTLLWPTQWELNEILSLRTFARLNFTQSCKKEKCFTPHRSFIEVPISKMTLMNNLTVIGGFICGKILLEKYLPIININ